MATTETIGLELLFNTASAEKNAKRMSGSFNRLDSDLNKINSSQIKSGAGVKATGAGVAGLGSALSGLAGPMAAMAGIGAIFAGMKQAMPGIGVALSVIGRTLITNLVAPLARQVMPALISLVDWFRDNRTTFLKFGQILANLFTVITSAIGSTFKILKNVIGSFFKHFDSIGSATINDFTKLLNFALLKISFVITFMQMLIEPVITAMGDIFGETVKGMTNAFGDFVTGFMEGLDRTSGNKKGMGRFLKTIKFVGKSLIWLYKVAFIKPLKDVLPLVKLLGTVFGMFLGQAIRDANTAIDGLIAGFDALMSVPAMLGRIPGQLSAGWDAMKRSGMNAFKTIEKKITPIIKFIKNMVYWVGTRLSEAWEKVKSNADLALALIPGGGAVLAAMALTTARANSTGAGNASTQNNDNKTINVNIAASDNPAETGRAVLNEAEKRGYREEVRSGRDGRQ